MKKKLILSLLQKCIWQQKGDGTMLTMIMYDDFLSVGLSPTVEYGEKYCDVIYAKRVIKAMGYNVTIGGALYITTKPTLQRLG